MSSPDVLGAQITYFFRSYLVGQRAASSHTVHAYRDALKLLLGFAAERRGCEVAALRIEFLDADLILAFLQHLEDDRHVGIPTRNARLAAVRSFFRTVAANEPTLLEQCRRILAIPAKRGARRTIDYLELEEIEAMLGVIRRETTTGLRDYTLIAFLYNTGARIQEVLNLNAADVQLERPFSVKLIGKGQKERICPLWPETAQLVRDLLAARGVPYNSATALFVNSYNERLSRDGVAYILEKHAQAGARAAPSLASKRIHPHMFRHTTAMHMLRAGDDRNAIASFLGHAQVSTTDLYVQADIEMKRKAIDACAPDLRRGRGKWRQPEVLEFLESL